MAVFNELPDLSARDGKPLDCLSAIFITVTPLLKSDYRPSLSPVVSAEDSAVISSSIERWLRWLGRLISFLSSLLINRPISLRAYSVLGAH
jgi:hypothetical protein